MLPRIMPVLTLIDCQIYRTKQFKSPRYVGDPINAVKIFNEKEVDELIIFDIGKDKVVKSSDFVIKMREISSQAFMPLSYGGGIASLDEAKAVFDAGFEKVIINTAFFDTPELIEKIAGVFGSQSVVVSIDVKNSFLFGSSKVYTRGKKRSKFDCISAANKAESLGAGEVIVRNISNDGMNGGIDKELISSIAKEITVPLVATGGIASLSDVKEAISCGAHSVAAGNLFVYNGAREAVLINYPDSKELERVFDVK
jgi:cyclase